GDLESNVATVTIHVTNGPLARDAFVSGDYRVYPTADISELRLQLRDEGFLDIPFSTLLDNVFVPDFLQGVEFTLEASTFPDIGRGEVFGEVFDGALQPLPLDGLGPRYRFIYPRGFSGVASFTYRLHHSQFFTGSAVYP